MIPLLKSLFLAGLMLAAPLVTFAATNNNIMLVFNGNTEVNRHTYNFIRQEFQSSGVPYNVYATLDSGNVKPGQFKAVIVISTNTATGVDPVLSKFMKAYAAPKELYLVNLLSRSTTNFVASFNSSSSAAGVDGVSSATTWGFGTRQMHSQWVQVLADYLEKK